MKLWIKNRKANDAAYNALIQAMEGDSAYEKVDNAKTDDLPGGDSALAWSKLIKKYEPKSVKNATNLEKEFGELKLTDPSKSPDDFIEELTT